MIMIQVPGSSTVAAVGYDLQSKLMRVGFVGGQVYEYRDVGAEDYAGLMTSQSKGKFLFSLRGKLGNGNRVADAQTATPAPQLAPEAPATPLVKETFYPDDCCTARLIAAKRDGDWWTCRECGCDWKATMQGELKHWAPVCDFTIVPPAS